MNEAEQSIATQNQQILELNSYIENLTQFTTAQRTYSATQAAEANRTATALRQSQQNLLDEARTTLTQMRRLVDERGALQRQMQVLSIQLENAGQLVDSILNSVPQGNEATLAIQGALTQLRNSVVLIQGNLNQLANGPQSTFVIPEALSANNMRTVEIPMGFTARNPNAPTLVVAPQPRATPGATPAITEFNTPAVPGRTAATPANTPPPAEAPLNFGSLDDL